jgi:hypothetical protein
VRILNEEGLVRFKLVTVAAAATALLVAGLTGQAGASGKPSASGHGKAVVVRSTDALLYSQNDNDSTVGISSQNFEAANDAFDDAAADDFVVPAGVRWAVQSVTVTGVYYNGTGPAASETVTFYKNSSGHPGAVVGSVTAVGNDSAGSFVIPLGTPVKLKPGTYWVSVVANQDFTPNGQWGWETRTVQSNGPAQWQNPGGGFGVCPTWTALTTCIPTSGGPDLMFALNGKAKPLP